MRYRKLTVEGALVLAIDMHCRCREGDVLTGWLRFEDEVPRAQIAGQVRALRAAMQAEMATHERTR